MPEPIQPNLIPIIEAAAREAIEDGLEPSGSPERQARAFARANPRLALALIESVRRASHGPTLTTLTRIAEKYRKERRDWHKANQHLIEYPRSPQASPELLDAELVAFFNYVGVEWGIDLAMARRDFAAASESPD